MLEIESKGLEYSGYLHDWFMFYIVGHLCNIWAINLTIDWCFTSADLLYLLSPCYASWHIGQGQGSSTLLCCWLFFLLCPRCILSFISFSMVHLHVVFGLPLFLFPSVVHFRTTFFPKKIYDLEAKEIKKSVTALATTKCSALHKYKKKSGLRVLL